MPELFAMLKVALTGGLASGKSFVGKTLESLGCFLIQADKLGHEVLLPGAEAYQAVIDAFGGAILDKEGFIQRKLLAAEVFQNPERLTLLNRLVHPPVRERAEQMLNAFSEREPGGIAIVEAAIHIETGGYRHYDKLLLAWCPLEEQVSRAMHRDQSTREEVMARLSHQMSLEEKRLYADYVVDTSGTKDETVRQTKRIYEELRRIAV